MLNCSHSVSALLILAVTSVSGWASATDDQTKTVETRVERQRLEPEAQMRLSRLVGPGRVRQIHPGAPGSIRRTFRVTLEGERVVSRVLLKEEITQPVPSQYLVGRAGWNVSRGSFIRSRVKTMEATAYDPSPATIGPGATGLTKTGIRARHGVVAVDPKVIPLGTLLFIEGYGFGYAADIGGAIRGNKIDLCFNRRAQAIQFGRRQVRVHILGRR